MHTEAKIETKIHRHEEGKTDWQKGNRERRRNRYRDTGRRREINNNPDLRTIIVYAHFWLHVSNTLLQQKSQYNFK